MSRSTMKNPRAGRATTRPTLPTMRAVSLPRASWRNTARSSANPMSGASTKVEITKLSHTGRPMPSTSWK